MARVVLPSGTSVWFATRERAEKFLAQFPEVVRAAARIE